MAGAGMGVQQVFLRHLVLGLPWVGGWNSCGLAPGTCWDGPIRVARTWTLFLSMLPRWRWWCKPWYLVSLTTERISAVSPSLMDALGLVNRFPTFTVYLLFKPLFFFLLCLRAGESAHRPFSDIPLFCRLLYCGCGFHPYCNPNSPSLCVLSILHCAESVHSTLSSSSVGRLAPYKL